MTGYRWRGGAELWHRVGAQHALQILLIEPLFEEANRTRRLLAQLMRGLDAAGIGSVRADLPGTGESLIETADVRFDDWREAIAAAAQAAKIDLVVSLRGGSLIDDAVSARGWWRLAPESGARVMRDLRRAQLANANAPALYAGHRLEAPFIDALDQAQLAPVSPLRVARLATDAAAADVKLPGSALWRRAEPGEDPALLAAMLTDIIAWTRQCAS